MDGYSILLERTRVPQPALQRFAVIQIFDKLRSAPPHLSPNSDAGRETITQCLHSLSAAIVDQSVRELCRLVVEHSKFDLSHALVELQSALEGSHPRFVNVFVKAVGFLVRFGFRTNQFGIAFAHAPENHPFVKVLLCRSEVQHELVQQVLLFVEHCKQYGMREVCHYLRPLVTFSIVKGGSSDSSVSSCLRLLVSSLTSLCCSSPYEADPLLDVLIDCLRCFRHGDFEDFRNFVIYAEFLVDTHIVVLRQLVKMGLIIHEAHLKGMKLLDALLSVSMEFESHYIGGKAILELSRRLLNVQKELGLHSMPEIISPMLSFFVILTQLELEDEELYVLNLLKFFLKWKTQAGNAMDGVACNPQKMLLFIFPIINLMTSPSKNIKLASLEFLLLLEKHSVDHMLILRDDLSAWKNIALREELFLQNKSLFVSKPEMLILRLLQPLWLQDLPSRSFFLNIYSVTGNNNVLERGSKSWISLVVEYAVWIAERRKACVSASSQEVITTEMPLLLSALVCVLVLHPSQGSLSVEAFGSLCNMEPKLGVTLLLVILYYSNVSVKCCSHMLLKLLAVLPSLASNSAMIPLIVQTIILMLHKDSHPVLYGTALRLLCKAWEINERIFEILRGLLLPECFAVFRSDRIIAISMATSLRDICRKNPDRGAELILSVAVCIEFHDPVIKAFEYQSLGHLCEADVVDFYTAWDVVAKHAMDYSMDPILAYSLCLFLRWGDMDAEAYIETSSSILQILWDVGSSNFSTIDPRWKKAQITALEALSCFEVAQIENSIHDCKDKLMNLLLSETDLDVLRAVGELEIRILAYQHGRRLVKEARYQASKIEKLLDVFPRVIFSSGKSCNAKELPGAALFCLPLYSKEANSNRRLKSAHDVFDEYHTLLKEIASSLHLSRNTVLAIVTLQSWKIFMQHWVKDYISSLDVKASSTVLDKTSKAANDILTCMIQVAEDSIARVAENIGLAVGAFCMVLPSSVHSVKVTASKFLLNWLFQHEREHRQWSAAIALGVISSCLHTTDLQQRLRIVSGLIEVACGSRNSFIKGACGLGLGYSCHDQFPRIVATESTPDQDRFSVQENDLLRKIIQTLSSSICQITEISTEILERLSQYVPPGLGDSSEMSSKLMLKSCDDVGEDIWGLPGLVLGLGTSVRSLYKVGSYDAMGDIKMLCMSWIAQSVTLDSCSFTGHQNVHTLLLATGACLVLPSVASFCRKVEMMHDTELNNLLYAYENLISKLILVKTSNIFHQNLLTASCVGAGSLLASILDEGLLSVDVLRVSNFLEMFKSTYSNTYPHFVHLGGLLGVVNAMGADAGAVAHHYCSAITSQTVHQGKESSDINTPLLSSSSFDKQLLELAQDIFLVAQNSDEKQLQAYSAWAMSFLRYYVLSKELQGTDESRTNELTSSKPIHQSFSRDSSVVMLSSWLMNLDLSKNRMHVNIVAAVLRCLSHAPRLPKLDWGAVVERCMRYEAHVANFPLDSSHKEGTLQMECLRFSLAHADKFDSLLSYLDELTDLSRFRTLGLFMQSCLLFHLLDILRAFACSRVQKLFEDLTQYLSSPISLYQKYNVRQKMFLQLSCWKGLCKCVNDACLDTSQYLASMEKCMEILFSLLPALPVAASTKLDQMSSLEWVESITYLSRARRAWLSNLLQISDMDLIERDDQSIEVMKKILAIARLVKVGSLPMTELAKLKSYLLNSKPQGMWEVLVEVVTVLQAAEGSVKKQWLLNVLEISCMTKFPSTALQLLGLLSGSCCKYMPLLVLDPQAVLIDLPVTLSSLFSNSNWGVITDTAVSYLWMLTERIYNWLYHASDESPNLHPIDPSETGICNLLVRVLLDVCTKLKGYLSLKNQLKLANMVIE